MMEGIKKGILRGFLELDEKLRKIPEVRDVSLNSLDIMKTARTIFIPRAEL